MKPRTADELPFWTDPKAGSFVFPEKVEGWLTKEEGEFLYELSVGNIGVYALEIGSYLGRSTICLLQGGSRVFCIDPFDGRATPNPTVTYYDFLSNITKETNFLHRCTSLVGTTNDLKPILQAGKIRFGLVFIDGDHSMPAVLNDAEFALSVCSGYESIIAFHDYESGIDPGVKMAIDYLINANGWRRVKKVGTIIALQPPLPKNEQVQETAG